MATTYEVPPVIASLLSECLTPDEEIQIHTQFERDEWCPDKQILWSGVHREFVQDWADSRGFQTFTAAMGPLMDSAHSCCLRHRKSNKAWSKYVKGASAIFAWHILTGTRVTVLSPPPPERFNPSGGTNYQTIEEPILKAGFRKDSSFKIYMVHPTVAGAEEFEYQIWPVDKTYTWMERFGDYKVKPPLWRQVKVIKINLQLRFMALKDLECMVQESELVPKTKNSLEHQKPTETRGLSESKGVPMTKKLLEEEKSSDKKESQMKKITKLKKVFVESKISRAQNTREAAEVKEKKVPESKENKAAGAKKIAETQKTAEARKVAEAKKVAAEAKKAAAKAKKVAAEAKKAAAEAKKVAAETEKVAAEAKKVAVKAKKVVAEAKKAKNTSSKRVVSLTNKVS